MNLIYLVFVDVFQHYIHCFTFVCRNFVMHLKLATPQLAGNVLLTLSNIVAVTLKKHFSNIMSLFNIIKTQCLRCLRIVQSICLTWYDKYCVYQYNRLWCFWLKYPIMSACWGYCLNMCLMFNYGPNCEDILTIPKTTL